MAGKKEPEDPGVVVYWKKAGKSYAMACDAYTERAQNLAAIAKTIEATRGIERWGAVTGEQAFQAYEALPAHSHQEARRPAHEVLGVAPDAPREVVEAAFKVLARKHHPDVGGSVAAFAEIGHARDVLLGGR